MIRNIITITIFISFILHSVNSDKTWDRVDVEKAPRHRDKYNRPADEIYAAIPVAVVYEDKDKRDEKSFEQEGTRTGKTENSVKDPNVNDFKDEVVDTTSKTESSININYTKIMNKDKNVEITTMKDTDDIFINFSVHKKGHKITKAAEVTNESESDSKDHENMMDAKVKTNTIDEKLSDHTSSSSTTEKSRRKNIKLLPPTQEVLIPVAVIYDTEADPISNKKDQIIAKSSTIQVPTTSTPGTGIGRDNKQRKHQRGSIRASSINVDKTETTTSREPKPQEKHDEIQSENKIQSKGRISVVPKMEQISVTRPKEHTSVIPQNKHISVTSQKAEFISKTAEESVKSTNNNNTKTGKRRRERDPVVPIIESNNQIYSQTGEFRYR